MCHPPHPTSINHTFVVTVTLTLTHLNVSKIYKKGIPNASNVNGANDPTAISAMWKTHFESLLNNVTTYANMQNVKERVQNTGYIVCKQTGGQTSKSSYN